MSVCLVALLENGSDTNMYVCICNALSDKTMKDAAVGATSAREVFRRCGAQPQCGKCLPEVSELIAESRLDEKTELAVAAE